MGCGDHPESLGDPWTAARHVETGLRFERLVSSGRRTFPGFNATYKLALLGSNMIYGLILYVYWATEKPTTDTNVRLLRQNIF
jgi:hypothetical protein